MSAVLGADPVMAALANWQAAGFNKPQRSGFIRTCPDRSTGSKPLEDLTLDGRTCNDVPLPILKRVLKGILKRISHVSAIEIRASIEIRATVESRATVTSRLSRLAYIEHEQRSHSFFHVIFTRPSYGDQRKAAQAAESVSKCPGIVPEAGTHSHPVHFRAHLRRAALITSSTIP